MNAILKSILVTGVAIAIQSETFAKSGEARTTGSGVRGGGHVVDVNSTPYLMDLVSQSVCQWEKGNQIIKKLPTLSLVLNKLEKLDWYFAMDLKDEINHLNFCMTGNLYTVSPYDYGSVVVGSRSERPRQAAYRLYDNVYIDLEILNRMPESNRAMLIVHEAMHAYLSMYTYERTLKLRSMVNAIDKVRNDEIVTRKDLHYAMEMNEINFPLTVGALDRSKVAISFFKSNFETQKKMLIESKTPESLIEMSDLQSKNLSSWDYEVFGQTYKRRNILKDALLYTMKDLSESELDKFINEKELKYLNLSQIALADLYLFSEEAKNIIFKSKPFKLSVDLGLSNIVYEQLQVKEFLVTASPEFQRLVIGNEEATSDMPVIKMEKAAKLPDGLAWLPEMIVVLHGNNSLDILVQNELFFKALGLKNQILQVRGMETKLQREKVVVLERLEMLSRALVKSLLSALDSKTDKETYEDIVKKLGLK